MITITPTQRKTLERIGVRPADIDLPPQQLVDEIIHRATLLDLDRERMRLRVYAVADLAREIRQSSRAPAIQALADALERAIR